MPRFIEGQDRHQVTLLPESLDDFIAEGNAVRVVDAFAEELDLQSMGFEGAAPAATGRPSYDPAVLLKIYIYGYLNRVQSSRRLERECQRNVEVMWLTGRLAPDFKTIADFRRDNGKGIRAVCRRFVELCRDLKLFSQAAVAIDGSKFKAVNSRDRNFTPTKIEARKKRFRCNTAVGASSVALVGPINESPGCRTDRHRTRSTLDGSRAAPSSWRAWSRCLR